MGSLIIITLYDVRTHPLRATPKGFEGQHASRSSNSKEQTYHCVKANFSGSVTHCPDGDLKASANRKAGLTVDVDGDSRFPVGIFACESHESNHGSRRATTS